ncbi:hypothetical protein PM082_024920 [Marasmius tenuissimus]|nr:hypothetical protein PM082_024920 [Marasmius tenuissimus]
MGSHEPREKIWMRLRSRLLSATALSFVSPPSLPMLRNLLYLPLTIHSCVCFEIWANPTVTVGVPTTATWSKGSGDDSVVGIHLIQYESARSRVLNCLDKMKFYGTVTFNVTEIGRYRLEGFSEGEEPECNEAPASNENFESVEFGKNGHPYRNGDHNDWQKDRHAEGPGGGGRDSDDDSDSDDDDDHQSHGQAEGNHTPGPDDFIEIVAMASPVDPDRKARIIGSVLGTFILLLILAIFIYLCRRRRRERRILHKEAGSCTSFESDRMMVSNRPWHQSPAYSFPRGRARSEYPSSDSASTSESTYSSSDASFSSIRPSDSVSQIRHPSKTYNFQIKRKPLRTSTDVSTISEFQGHRNSGSVDSSTMVSSSEALNRPKPVFPNPIPVIITTSATPQSSVVG